MLLPPRPQQQRLRTGPGSKNRFRRGQGPDRSSGPPNTKPQTNCWCNSWVSLQLNGIYGIRVEIPCTNHALIVRIRFWTHFVFNFVKSTIPAFSAAYPFYIFGLLWSTMYLIEDLIWPWSLVFLHSSLLHAGCLIHLFVGHFGYFVQRNCES